MPAVPVVEKTEPATDDYLNEEPPRRRRPGRPGLIAFIVSAIGVAGVGILVLQTFNGPPEGTLDSVNAMADRQSAASASASPSAAAPMEEEARPVAAAPRPVKNLGTKKGVYTLRGPSTAAPGAWTVFVLQGKGERVVRTDATAPFAAKVDTRDLPNGKYTLKIMVLRADAPAQVATRTLAVVNKKVVKKTPAPGAPATGGGTGSGSGSGSGGSGGGTGGGAATGVAGQVVSLTNAERAKAGCKALSVSPALTRSAQGHSADMAANNYFAHDSQDGRSPFDRMTAAGYSYRMAAENIAMGQQTAQDVVTAWMNSEGHRANILNCGLTQIGVGYAKNASGSPYWTQNFGTPA